MPDWPAAFVKAAGTRERCTKQRVSPARRGAQPQVRMLTSARTRIHCLRFPFSSRVAGSFLAWLDANPQRDYYSYHMMVVCRAFGRVIGKKATFDVRLVRQCRGRD